MKAPVSFEIGRFAASIALILTVAVGLASSAAAATPQQLLQEGRAAFEAGNYDEAIMKLGQVVEARPDDARARALLERARLQLARDPGLSYRRQVAAITLQEIDVQDVTMHEFITYVQAVIEAGNKERGEEEEGFVPNILLRGEGVDEKRFSMRLRNIPLDEALRMAGEMAGVRFRYEPHAVFGAPAAVE